MQVICKNIPLLILFLSNFSAIGWSSASNAPRSAQPLGLPAARETIDATLAALGKLLFFDKRLSADGTISCASCHVTDLALTDGKERAVGIAANIGTRNTPSLFNVRYLDALFWDGRVPTLEAQARMPLTNSFEHGLATDAAVLKLVRTSATYASGFQELFGHHADDITMDQVTKALASFERTLVAGNSPFDRYFYGTEETAMSASAVRGMTLFQGRARCSSCHVIGDQYALFTDGNFESSPLPLPKEATEHLGDLAQEIITTKSGDHADELDTLIASNTGIAALGRFVVTLDPSDIGKFKTPSLRNVAQTGPYMHNGSVNTLEEAVDLELYDRGSGVNFPIILTADERRDLLEFLKALTSPNAK